MKQRHAKHPHRPCTCRPQTQITRNWMYPPVPCRYGLCTEYRCPVCDGYLAGWGTPGCKCSGYVRWMLHPDMMPRLKPEAVKPSLPAGRRHRQRRRR